MFQFCCSSNLLLRNTRFAIGGRLVLLCIVLGSVSGCDPAAKTAAGNATTGSAPVSTRPLRVVVVDDEPLATVAQREWLAVSESKLELKNLTQSEFEKQIKADSLAADVIIYPTNWLGTLAEAKVITKMPRRVRESASFGEKDVLPWIRRGELVWGEQIYAVPLGSVALTLVSKTKIDDGANDQDSPGELPETWESLAEWRSNTVRVAQPLAEGWAAYTHLARSAAYVRSRGQVSTLFDFRSMEPLIASPPYVRALEELVASAKSVPEQIEWTPWDVQQALWDDKCDVGLTWMSPSSSKTVAESDEDSTEKYDWSFSELPGSSDVYRTSEKDWGTRSESAIAHVPLVGMPGRIGSVAQGSRRQRAGWNFLVKLSAAELSNRVSSSSRHTGPFRMSQQAARPWIDRRIGSSEAREYGVAVTTAYSRNLVFHSLRIPGHKAYLQSLDSAVRAAVAGDGESEELLKKVAEEWKQITETHGFDEQLNAYSRNLGMEVSK